ncbi:hypothetical protein PGTUg99_003249 [Puccinia graminis f. sp. tritici]|uniref:Uncharacterized protein n=1 Tax=Puccinia graminis f. sp. tritici TaxID=56615 RepID=A0A5B0SHK1_PUCGR|nr:hypothetical protein PGTUg99_003249 [Puccinia graminis f. sp. tritici]
MPIPSTWPEACTILACTVVEKSSSGARWFRLKYLRRPHKHKEMKNDLPWLQSSSSPSVHGDLSSLMNGMSDSSVGLFFPIAETSVLLSMT